jgi:pyruvate/2-oxoglutarate dehydrogenase complex dihydrolipoamide acyltransferase (E2) component
VDATGVERVIVTDGGQLERARLTFRARLLATEAAATDAVATEYAAVRTRLLREISQLTAQITESDITSPSQLYRLDRYRSLLDQTESELTRLGRAIEPTLTDAQSAVVQNAVDEGRQLALTNAAETSQRLALQVAQEWSPLPRGAINELIGSLSDGSPLRDWLDQYPAAISQEITDRLRDGVALGFSPRKISDQLTGVIDGAGSRLLVGTRSVVLDSYRSAALQQMAENADILDGWVWQAAHDTRTCAACLALDNGEIHPVTETFMKSHLGCRCNPRPVVAGAARPTRETGQDYLDGLPSQDQDRILGVSGGSAYRANKVQLNDFLHLDRDDRWGDRYRQGSISDAITKGGRRKPPTPTPAPAAPAKRKLTAEERAAIRKAEIQAQSDLIDRKITPEQYKQIRKDLKAGTLPGTAPKPTPGAAPKPVAAPKPKPTTPTAAKPAPPPKPPAQPVRADVATQPPTKQKPFNYDEKAFKQYRTQQWKEFDDMAEGEEITALRRYKGAGYRDINGYLRGGPATGTAADDVRYLDTALNRAKLQQDVRVYRGVKFEGQRVPPSFANLRVGSVMQDPSYLSTTTTDYVATGFAKNRKGNYLLDIRVPKGSRGLYIDPITNKKNLKEDEILLPRGSKLMVRELIQEAGGRIRVVADVIT